LPRHIEDAFQIRYRVRPRPDDCPAVAECRRVRTRRVKPEAKGIAAMGTDRIKDSFERCGVDRSRAKIGGKIDPCDIGPVQEDLLIVEVDSRLGQAWRNSRTKANQDSGRDREKSTAELLHRKSPEVKFPAES
jgi:hypothetical protein